VVPRVLVIGDESIDGVEVIRATHAPETLDDPFDVVIVDLSLPPLDGWLALATLGARARRPRLIARIPDRADAPRAYRLGADLCVLAGTTVHARALYTACQRHHEINSRRLTPSGVSV
jgi:DNA-binding NarL/FixJ family response regulator